MPILSLIPRKGVTLQQIKEQLLLLPGMDKDTSWLDRNIDNALGRLVSRTGSHRWVKFEKAGPGQSRRYFLTESGGAVCGMVITMYECNCLRRYLLRNQEGASDSLSPQGLLRLMMIDPFDFFYTLCALPELQRIAKDFFRKDPNTGEGRRWLSVYNELCTKKLSTYYNTRKKCISQCLYRNLTRQRGDIRIYRITNLFDTYRLLLAIMIYEWYRTASVDALDRDLNAVPDTVIITPGRISHMTQQVSFYLQALASVCDNFMDPVYDQIKAHLLRMELCLYFGIRESNATMIPVEQLHQLMRHNNYRFPGLWNSAQIFLWRRFATT